MFKKIVLLSSLVLFLNTPTFISSAPGMDECEECMGQTAMGFCGAVAICCVILAECNKNPNNQGVQIHHPEWMGKAPNPQLMNDGSKDKKNN